MVRVANNERKFMLWTMASAATLCVVADNFAFVIHVDVRATLFISATSSAQTNHLVVFFPFRKRIIGRVNGHKTAAIFHELDKRLLGFLRPWSRAVSKIGNHSVIVTPYGCKI